MQDNFDGYHDDIAENAERQRKHFLEKAAECEQTAETMRGFLAGRANLRDHVAHVVLGLHDKATAYRDEAELHELIRDEFRAADGDPEHELDDAMLAYAKAVVAELGR